MVVTISAISAYLATNAATIGSIVASGVAIYTSWNAGNQARAAESEEEEKNKKDPNIYT
jgi:hypothetical protein